MKRLWSISCLLSVLVFFLSACTTEPLKTDTILLSDLEENEALIVAVDRCHWNCVRGLIRIQDGTVSTIGKSQTLTDADIKAIDSHLAGGVSIFDINAGAEMPATFSTQILMRTAKMRSNRMVEVTPVKVYAYDPYVPSDGLNAYQLASDFFYLQEDNPWMSSKLVIDQETLNQLALDDVEQ